MPADYRINEPHRVVFSYGWGTLTFDDIIGHRARLAKDSRFHPDFRQIVDFNFSKIDLSTMEIAQLAKPHNFAPDARRAFIVTSALQHGLTRMFLAFGEAHHEARNFQICRSLDEAIAWVDVPPEVATKAFEELRSQKPGSA